MTSNVAPLFRAFRFNDGSADEGDPSTNGWAPGLFRGWLDANRGPGFDRTAAPSDWAGVQRLQSPPETRPTPLASPASHPSASSSSGASSATSGDPALAADIAGHEQNGSLSYNSVLTILDDAAAGGMTASKFAALKSFASELNAIGGISVTAYVQQIADDVIDGNSANATWNGGASTATKLGNLSATSSQTQADELIDEWFLGANLPSLSLSAVGQANLNPSYQNSTLRLYGPSGARRTKTSTRAISATAIFCRRSAKSRSRTPRRLRT